LTEVKQFIDEKLPRSSSPDSIANTHGVATGIVLAADGASSIIAGKCGGAVAGSQMPNAVRFLRSYFARKFVSAFFPVSVTLTRAGREATAG